MKPSLAQRGHMHFCEVNSDLARPSGAPSKIQFDPGGHSSRLIRRNGCGGPPAGGNLLPPLLPLFVYPLVGDKPMRPASPSE